ncbi:MAG: hypothetical protein H7Y43_11180 [Akkermansiaceae bacterium]|nr:hypothetical protein [Verrucomicrobiales bacterium]
MKISPHRKNCFMGNTATALCALALVMSMISSRAAQIKIDLSQYQKDCGIGVAAKDADTLQINWPTAKNVRGEMILDLRANQPLIQSLSLSEGRKPAKVIATKLDPVTTLTIGERDKKKFDEAFRGMVFFENPRQRPHETHTVALIKKTVRVSSNSQRVTVSIGEVSAGSFSGELRFTFYRNSPLIHAETVVSTSEELRAVLYDTGLSSVAPDWKQMVWLDPLGKLQSAAIDSNTPTRPLAVKQRTVVAESSHGSIAVFPAPHQYFYPLDFADNFMFTWFGSGYSKMPAGFGFGIRQPLDGDKRWVPWFDAPAHSEHHLGVFYLLSAGDGEQALKEVARYTHGDRFKELSGHRTFTSHYHIEHTLDFLNRQKEQKTVGIPKGLETPGFITKFKDTGVDIVHLAEFHHGWTPGQKTPDRLRMLKVMHEECARLSDDQLLLLPGEEPNLQLGGHWISFFPKPVYWVLNRGANEPFEENIEGYGKVYHVGSEDDVLKLMEKENGLMWTAHARIKSSIKFPDDYRDQPFYKSDHFLGAAWKSIPADLSRPTLGWRVLDLFDDMNQWGQRKQVLGEVDVFRVEPDYELYAHMNINYLKMKRSPKFAEGWQPVLDTLRGGKFFTTTGEILIPQFTVAGKESGETIVSARTRKAELHAELEWTFPLAFAEVISGDGQSVRRQRIDLSDTESFATRKLRLPVDLKDQKWIRLEVWDIAANGAFTQPVWME